MNKNPQMLINQLCDRYLAEYAVGKKSADGDRWMIEKYIRPELGHKAAAKVKYADVAKLHRSMKATPYQANRVLSLLSVMFTLAERWEIPGVDRNPCSAVKRYKEKRRRAYATDAEVKALINALEARFDKYPLEVALLLLCLYTGARCGEMKGARWDEIKDAELYLDDSKTGQCIIYLTPQALAVLEKLPRSRDYIIGLDTNPRYTWAAVLKQTGIKNLRVHDLRHCFASIGISSNLPLPKIGGLLRHASPSTTQGYAHLIPSEGRAAAIAIGQSFERIVA